MLIPEDFRLERKRLGELLRLAREEECLTVREVAARSGLDFTHVSKIELGKTNVSLEKFARLCFALMIPPGIVLESCLEIRRPDGFLNDPMVVKFASEQPDKVGLDNEINDFIAGTALALSYTLKSSNPLLMLDNMEFPVAAQRADFKKFARQKLITMQPAGRRRVAMPPAGRRRVAMPPAGRRKILFRAITEGWDFLSSIGLLSGAHLGTYLANSAHGKRPWIPIPEAPFFQTELAPVDARRSNIQVLISVAQREKLLRRQKIKLTETASYEILSDVKRPLKNLLARLELATKESGKMSALADFLGKSTGHKVPLASVSRWLSGKREPGGEITLLLLNWVEQQERQK